jgi:hypothetical protein
MEWNSGLQEGNIALVERSRCLAEFWMVASLFRRNFGPICQVSAETAMQILMIPFDQNNSNVITFA